MPGKLNLGDLTVAQIKEICQDSSTLSDEFIRALAADPRAGVKQVYERVRRERDKRAADMQHLRKLFQHEKKYWQQGYSCIAGVDEAGRGPLAGPVVAAAVILPGFVALPGLDDSKKMSSQVRYQMAANIKQIATDWSVGLSTVNEILCYNVYWATILAMKRAVQSLKTAPDFLLVDGFPVKELDIPQKPLVGGDGRSASIAAASVIAKVTRDELMETLHNLYPQYGFARHKGYATKEHLEALKLYGPCPLHRLGFKPVQDALHQYNRVKVPNA